MKQRNTEAERTGQGKPAPIKTTFFELLEELTRMTKDDALVLAMMKNIFASYQVRFARSLAPVRLVHGDSPAKAARLNLGRRSSAWA